MYFTLFLITLISLLMSILALSKLLLITPTSIKSSLSSELFGINKPGPVKILFWTTSWGVEPKFNDYCPLKEPCIWTSNREEFHTADVLIFHAFDINKNDMPMVKSKNIFQKYVFQSYEAPPTFDYIVRGNYWGNCEFKTFIVKNMIFSKNGSYKFIQRGFFKTQCVQIF